MEREEIAPVEGFLDYEVTSFGRVYNVVTGKELTLSPTQYGELTVGFTVDGRQCRRSVKVLVARAFVDGETDIYDTPIQMDGNRENLHASNIVWRPRWFAWRYIQQFNDPQQYFFTKPVADIDNMFEYSNVFEAAIANGLLFSEVWYGILNNKPVFPTGQFFFYLDK